LLAALACLYAASLTAQEKQPVPSADAQEEALKLVEEVYGEDWIKAKTNEAKSALARKLLQGAKESTDLTNRYVLLRVARDMGMMAGDADAAMRAVNKMAEIYEFDSDPVADTTTVFKMKLSTLTEAARSARSSEEYRVVVRYALSNQGHAAHSDRFPLAANFGELALSAARKSGDRELAKQVVAQNKEVREMAEAYAEVKEAQDTLEQAPVDPDANLAVGKYHCFIKGDWDKGVAMLALGNDPELKKLAVKELEGIASPSEQMAQADGWWEIAENESGAARNSLLARAYAWYQAAAPQSSSLLRQKAEKRLASIEDSVPDLKRRLAAQGRLATTASVAGRSQPSVPTSKPTSTAASDAIELGLKWLIANQRKDGSWTFATGPNGGSLTDCTGTATAMALIPLLRAGHTHRLGAYKENVGKGLSYLMGRMKVDRNGGSFHRPGSNMYGHGICTIALGEAYARSKDTKLRAPAQAAINFIVYAQDPKGGGWRYLPRQAGDTSVLSWQLQALVISDRAGIEVPKPTYAGAAAFLDSVQSSGGVFYGYKTPGEGESTTAIGLWSRLHLGWKQSDSRIESGVKYFVDSDQFQTNHYRNYYVSCFLKGCGQGIGDEWAAQMQSYLVRSQSRDDDTAGSWLSETGGHGVEKGGRLYCTSMALMTLQNVSSTPE